MIGAATAAPARPAEPRLWHAALAGLIVLLLALGLSRFGYAPLIPALVQAGWFTPAQAAYLGAANLAGYLLGALAVGWLARRLSPSLLIRGGLVICTASFAACAFPLGFAWYFAWRFASGAIGGLLMVLAVPGILAVTPVGRRGLVGGIMFTGIGLGVILSGTLVPWLVGFSLRTAWLSFAATSALLTAVAWRGLPTTLNTVAAPSAGAAQRARAARPAAVIVLLILAYAGYGAGFAPHTVFWVDYIARGLGLGIAVGGSYWALFGLGTASAPLAMGLLADKIGFAVVLRCSLFANAAAVALPLFSSAPWALAVASLGVGACGAGIALLGSGRVIELVPAPEQRRVWGWMTLAFSIAYAAAAYGLSYLFARTGSYALLFEAGAVALFCAGLLELAGAFTQRAAPIGEST